MALQLVTIAIVRCWLRTDFKFIIYLIGVSHLILVRTTRIYLAICPVNQKKSVHVHSLTSCERLYRKCWIDEVGDSIHLVFTRALILFNDVEPDMSVQVEMTCTVCSAGPVYV